MNPITTSEGTVEFFDGYVRKTYADAYYHRAQEYVLPNEVIWYQHEVVSMMPKLLHYQHNVDTTNPLRYLMIDFMDTAYAGTPVQEFPSRQIVVAEEHLNDFYLWLVRLRLELRSAGVHHRDIHGKNILTDGLGNFSLIDWSWATHDPHAPMGPTGMGTDDEQIDAFLQALDARNRPSAS